VINTKSKYHIYLAEAVPKGTDIFCIEIHLSLNNQHIESDNTGYRIDIVVQDRPSNLEDIL